MNQKGEFILTGYDLVKVLHGGMADVYICNAELWDGLVAVKTLKDRLLLDAGIRTLFVRECHTWSLLGEHKNLVRFRAIHLVQGARPLLVMDYVESSLRNLLAQKSPLPLEAALKIALNICDAMNYCAGVMPGIVHSDLKPENVMIAADMTAKVTDFGLVRCQLTARSSTDAAPVAFPDSTKDDYLPPHGAGTPLYMSPEQAAGLKLDAASDVYSFGCILYEMLAGAPLLREGSSAQTLRGQIGRVLSPLRLSAHDDRLADIIAGCLRREPKERPSFRQLRDELAEVARAECGLNVPIPDGSPSRADFNVVMALIKLGDLDTAEKVCLGARGRSGSPDLESLEADFCLGQVARRRGDAEAAVVYFERSLRADDGSHGSMTAWIMDNLAQTYRQLGDLRRSIEISEEAIKLQPEVAVLWHNLGETYREAGRIDDAIRCLREARRIAGDPIHYAVLANTLSVGKHEWREALAELQVAMRAHHNVAPVHAEYARALAIGFSQLIQEHGALLPSWVSMLEDAEHHIEKALALGYDEGRGAGIKESVAGLMTVVRGLGKPWN